jgi:5'-phosphate synthase pdxT subunit
MRDYDLSDKLRKLAETGLPILGTCAGMILLAKQISDSEAEPLGLMDITVRRNAFGRQRESFEAELSIPALGEKPFPGVFIRAPIIEQANGNVTVLTRLDDGTIVAARQEKLITTAFHPELTDDPRFHKYFVDIVSNSKPSQESNLAESNH